MALRPEGSFLKDLRLNGLRIQELRSSKADELRAFLLRIRFLSAFHAGTRGALILGIGCWRPLYYTFLRNLPPPLPPKKNKS